MNSKQSLGKFGEECAFQFLLQKKYEIMSRNYKCKFGEIDIIAKKNNILIFFEIKTRRNKNFGYPVESITKIKQKHIYNTAIYYLLNNKILYDEIMFDAIEVYFQNNIVRINHIKNIITNMIK